MPNQELETASSEDLVQKQWERRDYFGVHPQSQEGFSYVGLHIPVGRLQADDMDELARLADTYGSGELRLTVEQNIIIPNIENSKIESLLEEPRLRDKFSPEPPLLMKGLVACTGNQFCGQAIIETKARAMKVTEDVQRFVSDSASENALDRGGCVLGRKIGSDSHLGKVYKKSVPCKDMVPLVVDILVKHFGAVPREREEVED
ncbi:hypothetical protein GH714_034576 [Hevea brasiliensis]|uniref:Nitrite/Sulfite reductase ferredoxin-like domain-containing protein n=1 Tax=Hevea brasiliensis TaxID=3981 RepID=A0A6A6N4S1_HEVBR|nr:hypothetical protein GH714_034576 [Hevea brasiliensis]